jgi:hypothetical protein
MVVTRAILSYFPPVQNLFLYLLKININIILRSTIRSVKYSVTFQTDLFGIMFKNRSYIIQSVAIRTLQL